MSASNMHVVKVAVKLANAAQQGSDLRDAIQKALNTATKKNPIVVRDFRYEPDKSAVTKFRTTLQRQITNEMRQSPIKLSFKAASITKQERQAMLADLQEDLDTRSHLTIRVEDIDASAAVESLRQEITRSHLTIRIKDVDASAAVENLRREITRMLSGLSIGGLKAFLADDATKAANGRVLDSFAKNIQKTFEGISSASLSDEMSDEFRAITAEIERIRTLEGAAQDAAINGIRERIKAYRTEIEVKQKAAAIAVAEAKEKKASDAAARKEADSIGAAQVKVDVLKKRVAEARLALDKIDDVDLKTKLQKQLDDLTAELDTVTQKAQKTRDELLKALTTDVGAIEKSVKDAYMTPEREQNESEISSITKEYDSLMKTVRETYSDTAQRDAVIAKLQEEQRAVKALSDATTAAQNEAMSAMREKLALSQREVQSAKDAQKAEANKAKTEAAAQRQQTANAQRAVALQKTIQNWVSKNTKAYSQYRVQINQMLQMLQREGGLTHQELSEIALQLSKIQAASKQAGIMGATFFGSLGSIWDKFKAPAITAMLGDKVWDKARDAIQAIKDVDAAMTELKKVTDLTAQSYENFTKSASQMSRDVGATLADTINATADFARLGYDITESAALAEAALTYKNVGDGIDDISTATESLISTIKAFGVEAMDSMDIVDKYNEVGNNFAISSAGIGEAMRRSAAALAAAGNDINESIGLVTGMNTVVQDPDIVGTALKTVSMYLRAAKTEAEEAGIETDGMAESVSDLREELKMLTGIDIQINDTTFKSTFQIMKELSEVWDHLTDVSQANILQLIGGKRNGNVVTSLLNNFEEAIAAAEDAQDAMGSAAAENEKYLDSINGKLQIMQANFETLVTSVVDSELVKMFIDLGNVLLGIAQTLQDINMLIPAIIAGFGIKSAINSKNAVNGVIGQITNMGAGLIDEDIINQSDAYKRVVGNVALEIGKLNAVQKESIAVKLASAAADGKISKELTEQLFKLGLLPGSYAAASGAAKGFGATVLSALKSVNKVLIALEVASVLWGFYKNWKDGEAEKRQQTIDTGKEVSTAFSSAESTYKKNIEELQALKAEYDELSAGVDENGINISLTASEYDRFLEIIAKVEDISPSIVEAYNNQTDGVNKYKDAIVAAIDAEEQILGNAQNTRFANTDSVVSGAREEYKDVMADVAKDVIDVWGTVDTLINDSISKTTEPLRNILGEQLYNEFIGLNSEMSSSEVAEAIIQNRDEIIAKMRSALDDDGNFLFDSKHIAQVDQAIDTIDAKLNNLGDTAERVRDQFVFNMDYSGGYGGDIEKQYDQIVASGLDGVFSDALLGVIDLTAADGGESAAKTFLSSFATYIGSNEFSGMLDMVRQLKDGKITIEDFNRAVADLKGTGNEIIDQSIIHYLGEEADYAVRVSEGLVDYNVQVAKVANGPLKMFEAGQKGFELLGQAMEEMAADGEVSMDTLSKMQDILPDGVDVLERFVDLTSGKRVLNEDAFRDYLKQYAFSEVELLKEDAQRLSKQSEYHYAMAAAVEGNTGALQALLKADLAYEDSLGDLSQRQRITTKEALKEAGFSADYFNKDGLFLTSISAGQSSGEDQYDFAYDANVVFSVTPVYRDKDTGEDVVMTSDAFNKYVSEKLAASGGDINRAMELDAADKKLFLNYQVVEDSDSVQEVTAAIEERNKLFNEGYMANHGLGDFSSTELTKRAEAETTAMTEQTQAAEDYIAAMRGVENTSDLTDLTSMWDALEKQATSSSSILDAQKQVADGAALTQSQLMELSREHPEYNWFEVSGDITAQSKLLERAASAEESAFNKIILTRKANLEQMKQQSDLTDEQKEEIEKQIAVLDAVYGSGKGVMESLFPPEETDTWEEQQKKIQEVISTVQEYSELMQTVQKEIEAGGSLTPETMLSMQTLFGPNWKDFLEWDLSGTKAMGVHMQQVTGHVNEYIDTTLDSIDANGDFAGSIKDSFSKDPGELKASERIKDYISLIGNVTDLTGEIGRELASNGSNSLSTLEDLISLMGNDYADAVVFSGDKITILRDKVIDWQMKQIEAFASLSDTEKDAIKNAYEQAAALENLQGTISDVGKASSLIDTIQEEITDSGYNSFDTLSSYIEMMGDDWEKHVTFSDKGITLSTTAIYDQMANSIDAVIAVGTPMNTMLKQQLQTSLEVEAATKSLSEAYGGLETAISGYANIGSGIELTHDMISQLIETDARYAQAIEYQNGRLQLNKEKYDEVTKSVEQNVKAQAQAAAQAILTGKEYQDLIKKMQTDGLDTGEQNRLDSLNAQVMAFKVLENSVDSSTSALQRFLNATDQVNAVTYEGAQSAYQTIEDVLYNKDSDMYGMIGHEKFEEAVKLMISPGVEIDTKEFDRQFKILSRYFEDSSKGVDTLHKDMLSKGIIDKATGQIKTTVGEAAELLGLTENALRFAVDQYNQYQLDANKIDIGGMTNEEVQEKTGIGKLMEDTVAMQETFKTMEEDPLAIPVDPTLENIEAVNAGLDETQTRVNMLNGTPVDAKLNIQAGKELDELIEDYREEIKNAVELGVDPAQTLFGNVDAANRQILEWTEENLAKYRQAYESFGWTEADLRGTISTIAGASAEYDGIEIAFTPILQTEDGPKFLDYNTIDQYINGLIEQANADGSWTDEELLSLDTTGLEVAGQKISNILMGIGDNAMYASQAMHFVGPDGAIISVYTRIVEAAESAGATIDEVNQRIFDGVDGADIYREAVEEASKEKLSTSGVTGPMNAASVAGDKASASLSNVANTTDQIAASMDQINAGNLDVGTSGIMKDLIAVLSKLGDIAKKLNAIDGMDVSASVSVTQTTTAKKATSTSSSSSSSSGRWIDNLIGTASASGTNSFAGGKTLVGELGAEMVVDPSKNKWYTVGSGGPEFVHLPKGAIVFDAEQTRALLSRGRTSERGDAMASGTPTSALTNSLNNLLKPLYSSAKQSVTVTVNEVQGPKQQTSSSKDSMEGSPSAPKTSSSSKKSSSSGSSSSSSKEKEEEQSVLEKLQEKYQELVDTHEHLIEHQEFLFRNAERGLDFEGMETSLTKQVQIYKDLMNDAQKGINEMIANGAQDSDKELQSLEQAYWDAHDSMYEALNQINTLYVDALTDKIDGIQNAYSNLANAADELAESGAISVDTFQALINNGVEYMSLLEKVNGQYVINEKGINELVKAEKERLAVESALSYLGKVQQALNDKDADLLKNLTDLSNRIGQSSWDAVFAQAELLKALGLSDAQYQVVLENIEALRAVAFSVTGDITTKAEKASDTIKEGLEDQQDALDDILSLTQDLIKHETEERIEAIEDEIDQYKEIIRLKKESLQVSRDEKDYIDSVAEKTAEIAKLQAKIDQLSLDDSRSAAAERAALQEELSKLQKDLGDVQSDHAYDAQIDALEKQEEAYEKNRQQEIEALENNISSAEKLYQQSIARLNAGWGTLYDQLIEWNASVGSSLNSEITQQWELAAEAVKKYGTYSQAVKGIDSALTEDKGNNIAVSKSSSLPVFHEGGVVGGSSIGQEIMAVVQKGEVIINEAGQEVLYKIIDFQRYLGEKLGTAFSGLDFSSRSMRNAVSTTPLAASSTRTSSMNASSSFVFNPTIHVEINGAGEQNARDAKQFGEKIAATAIDQLREAFVRKGVTTNVGALLRQS